MCKDLDVRTKRIPHGPPDKLHALLINTLCLVLIVKPSEKPRIEAHISKEAGICTAVTEGVDLPADSRGNSEFIQDELVAYHHIVNHVVEVRARLVMHAPASVEQLKTAFFHELSNLILQIVGLVLPPHAEEFHLDVGKASIRISQQLVDYFVKD